MRRTLVANAVGLTRKLITARTPTLQRLAKRGLTNIDPALPAVTCSAQATYLTGLRPDQHGAVGNGWYHRDTSEVRLWQQSAHLVRGERVWDAAKARDPAFTSANLFWWFAMYGTPEATVTPRPMYPADGRKLPDVWTHPPALRCELQDKLGTFPLFRFWGPLADVTCTRWIVDAALEVDRTRAPTATFVYLPHLDYELQRRGPEGEHARAAAAELDAELARLVAPFEARGDAVVVLSEYGIEPATTPVHVNRALRAAGLLTVRPEEHGRETLDAGASRAFAVADHQVAHVYVNDPACGDEVLRVLSALPGVGAAYVGPERAAVGLDHSRAGDVVAFASAGAWFTYYFWQDDALAPDYARTVDIHRKPGYDPAELFLDPALALPKARVAAKLLKRKLGFRQLLNVTPLDATLVKGTHGRRPEDRGDWPVFLGDTPHVERALAGRDALVATDVKGLILSHLFPV